jgi:hypothetical protein
MIEMSARSRMGLPAVLLVVFAICGCGGADRSRNSNSRVSASSRSATKSSLASGADSGTSDLARRIGKRFKGDQDDDDRLGVSPRARGNRFDSDVDSDNDVAENRAKGYLDSDDSQVTSYGQPASAKDKAAVTALVERYYVAARKGKGATACGLIYSLFREAIPEDYGSVGDLPYAQGKTCAVVMSKIFRHDHEQTTGPVMVTAIRISGNRGYALLGSKTRRAGYLDLRREHGSWKIIGLLASRLP